MLPGTTGPKIHPAESAGGIYKPTAGKIIIDGKVATLLDPLAGMAFDATGEENIFFRGHLLGMTAREIELKMEDIESFTELGDFLRLPLKPILPA